MQCGRYTESIQELTDGTLGPIRRAELERHLEGCAGCRALVRDLRAIRDAAADLDPMEPPARVWLQVAGRLRQEGRVTAATAAAPAERYRLVLALAAALVLAVGLATILLVPGGRGRQPPSTTAATPPDSAGAGNAGADATVQGVEAEFRLAEQHYQNAITKLEEAARLDQAAASPASDTATLDAQTAAMLQKNLRVIDDAIAESRAALRDQPQSAPARDACSTR